MKKRGPFLKRERQQNIITKLGMRAGTQSQPYSFHEVPLRERALGRMGSSGLELGLSWSN